MLPDLQKKQAQLGALCLKHRVRRLAVFGSAANDDFDAASSDVDFVVEFEPMAPALHADSYFGLLEDLERLLGYPVDLVEYGPIRNPMFKRVVDESRVNLYDSEKRA